MQTTVLLRRDTCLVRGLLVQTSQRESMIRRVDQHLREVSVWGDNNLVTFNATKTQACLFTAKRSPFTLTPTFRGVSLPLSDSISLLGVDISSNLNFGGYLETRAKTAAKKLGILNKVRQYFTPEQLTTLYKAQIRSSMEYCCHLWDGSAKYQLEALEAVDRRARKLIGDGPLVQRKLESLEHRRKVASLSVFIGYTSESVHRDYTTSSLLLLFIIVPPDTARVSTHL